MKRIKFYFIACLVAMNGLFIGYAVGFNSRHVLIVDAKMPAYVELGNHNPVSDTEDDTNVKVVTPSKSKSAGASGSNKSKPSNSKGAVSKSSGVKNISAKHSGKSAHAGKPAPASSSNSSTTK